MESIQILLATFNGARYLPEQLASLQNQTEQNFSLLISDDGSTDGTADILRDFADRWQGRVEFATHEVPFGNARDNFFWLMEQSSADYVLFCDQDDVWNSDKLKKTLAGLRALEQGNPEMPVLFFTDQTPVDASLKPIAPSLMRMQQQDASQIDYRRILFQNIVTGCAAGANRAAVQLALKCCDRQGVIMHDWWLGLAVARFGKIGYLDESTLLYRQHGGNSVGAKRVGSLGHIVNKLTHLKQLRQVILCKKKQAAVFYATYQEQLSGQEAEFLRQFAKSHSGWRFFWRNRSWINGAWRKAGFALLG